MFYESRMEGYCKPKDEGGYNIKDLKCKIWFFLRSGDGSCCRKNVVKKCDYPSNVLYIDKFKFSSFCWKELCALGKGLENFQD
jgi:hypothetical protein